MSHQKEKILSYIDLIKKHPKKDCKFFFQEDEEDGSFIVVGNKLKLLPVEYGHLYSKDEFYVHINAKAEKVMFYAYDLVEYLKEIKINEEEGYMKWNDVESSICNFLALNIKDLCTNPFPYINVHEKNRTHPANETTTHNYTPHHHTENHSQSGYSPYSSSSTSYAGGWNSSAYRERESFYDKLWEYLKNNRTSKAVDHIDEFVNKMISDEKFEDLDYILKFISFDKLNIPSMFRILDSTKKANSALKGRKDFFEKVKTYIFKVKPTKAEQLLKNYEIIEISRQN